MGGAEISDVFWRLVVSEAMFHRWRSHHPLRWLVTPQVSEAMFHRWRSQYGGLKVDDMERLKALEAANARLERVVAGKELEVDAWRKTGRAK